MSKSRILAPVFCKMTASLLVIGMVAMMLHASNSSAQTTTSYECSPSDFSPEIGALSIGESLLAPVVTAISRSELYLHRNVQSKVRGNKIGGLSVEFTNTAAGGSVVLVCGCGAGCGGQCDLAITSDTAYCQGGCYKEDGSACTSCMWRKLDSLVLP